MVWGIQILILILSLLSVVACDGGGSLTLQNSTEDGRVGIPGDVFKPQALLWESVNPEGVFWSAAVYGAIGGSREVTEQLLPGADDVESFCPKYFLLSDQQRMNFWGYLISAIAMHESGFNPLARASKGRAVADEVTGQELFPEGLLQVSYQDSKRYQGCRFAWEKDKNLHPLDARKTTLNPLINLQCGVHILAKQVQSRKRIALKNNGYWPVLEEGGSRERLAEISAATQALPFCR